MRIIEEIISRFQKKSFSKKTLNAIHHAYNLNKSLPHTRTFRHILIFFITIFRNSKFKTYLFKKFYKNVRKTRVALRSTTRI